MNPKIKRILTITIPLVLGVFLVWYSLSQISLEQLVGYFKKADYTFISLGVFFGLLSHLSRAYRWRFQLQPMGYHIKLGNSVMAVFATYLINYTVPRAGEVARASILTNYEGVPFEKGFGTIVAERIADLIMMFCIIVVTLFLQFDFIYGFLVEKFNPTKIIMGVFLLLFFGIVFTIFIKRSNLKIALKIKSFVNGLIEGALSIFKMKKKVGIHFSYTFYMDYVCSYVLCNLFCFRRN